MLFDELTVDIEAETFVIEAATAVIDEVTDGFDRVTEAFEWGEKEGVRWRKGVFFPYFFVLIQKSNKKNKGKHDGSPACGGTGCPFCRATPPFPLFVRPVILALIVVGTSWKTRSGEKAFENGWKP